MSKKVIKIKSLIERIEIESNDTQRNIIKQLSEVILNALDSSEYLQGTHIEIESLLENVFIKKPLVSSNDAGVPTTPSDTQKSIEKSAQDICAILKAYDTAMNVYQEDVKESVERRIIEFREKNISQEMLLTAIQDKLPPLEEGRTYNSVDLKSIIRYEKI